ncbi:serine/threonine protein kinase, AGC [Ascosphaera aggregata]|nr:serine/threonine protein kinase, AGC [Ascosphaera aggregata]
MEHESSRLSHEQQAPRSPTLSLRSVSKLTSCPSPSQLHHKRHHDCEQDQPPHYNLDRPRYHQSKQFKFTPTHSPDIKCLDLGDLPPFLHVRQLPTPEQSRPTTPGEVVIRRGGLFGPVKEKEPEPEKIRQKLSVDCFEKLRTLGTGTFARVWLVKLKDELEGDESIHPLLKSDGQKKRVWALKELRKADVVKLHQVEHVRNERRSLEAASNHPFVTSLITTFSDSESLYMLLEYCSGGELFTHLRRTNTFPVSTARFYVAEIVLIFAYLHNTHTIAYRDLKPENLLLSPSGHIKLVDFGFAKQLGNSRETYTLCGTPEYLAPEIILNTGHGCAADWWALGILIYEFLVGQPPFYDRCPMTLYDIICAGKIKFPESIDPVAKNLISRLCTVDPKERLGHALQGGVKGVMEHEFFKGVNWDDLRDMRVTPPIIPHVEGEDDTRNFDEYPDPEMRWRAPYTKKMRVRGVL